MVLWGSAPRESKVVSSSGMTYIKLRWGVVEKMHCVEGEHIGWEWERGVKRAVVDNGCKGG